MSVLTVGSSRRRNHLLHVKRMLVVHVWTHMSINSP